MGLLSEIALLAKAGYTVAEVRELMQLGAEPAKNEAPKPPAGPDPEVIAPPEDQSTNPETLPTPSGDQSPAQSGDQSDDLLLRIADLEKQLEAAQSANRKQDVNKNQKTEQEQLEDLARSFM